jgi:hypothetical protein
MQIVAGANIIRVPVPLLAAKSKRLDLGSYTLCQQQQEV